jgi:hypothetical protein
VKQKKVVRKLIENGGNLRKAVRESGYSEAYAHSQKITKTKTWADLLEEFLPDEALQQKHKELLNAKKLLKVKGIPVSGMYEEDSDVQSKALDMAYKLKGKYAPEKTLTISPYDDLSPEELDAEIAKIEKQLNVKKK